MTRAIRHALARHAPNQRLIGIDSISAAVDGKLGDDDVARAYNRALDHLPPSLAAAHIPKTATSDNQMDTKAFGSAFFHNYARCTYSVKKQQGANPNIEQAIRDPRLLGGLPCFHDLSSWPAWLAFTRAVYGCP